MRIPGFGEKIEIEGADYELVSVPGLVDHHQMGGQVRFIKQTIVIDPAQSPALYIRTLIHEAIEVINDNHELDLPHPSIRTLEVGLTNLLVDNQFCFAKECDCGRS